MRYSIYNIFVVTFMNRCKRFTVLVKYRIRNYVGSYINSCVCVCLCRSNNSLGR